LTNLSTSTCEHRSLFPLSSFFLNIHSSFSFHHSRSESKSGNEGSGGGGQSESVSAVSDNPKHIGGAATDDVPVTRSILEGAVLRIEDVVTNKPVHLLISSDVLRVANEGSLERALGVHEAVGILVEAGGVGDRPGTGVTAGVSVASNVVVESLRLVEVIGTARVDGHVSNSGGDYCSGFVLCVTDDVEVAGSSLD
jgi:hypothetical protein